MLWELLQVKCLMVLAVHFGTRDDEFRHIQLTPIYPIDCNVPNWWNFTEFIIIRLCPERTGTQYTTTFGPKHFYIMDFWLKMQLTRLKPHSLLFIYPASSLFLVLDSKLWAEGLRYNLMLNNTQFNAKRFEFH